MPPKRERPRSWYLPGLKYAAQVSRMNRTAPFTGHQPRIAGKRSARPVGGCRGGHVREAVAGRLTTSTPDGAGDKTNPGAVPRPTTRSATLLALE